MKTILLTADILVLFGIIFISICTIIDTNFMDNKMNKQILLLFLLTIVLINCGLLDPFSNNDDQYLPIEDIIKFFICEGYESFETIARPQTYLYLSTEKDYPLGNYRISSNLFIWQNQVIVNICGIKEPESGPTIIAPATERKIMDLENGKYELLLNSRDRKDIYTLLITDNCFQLSNDSLSFTKPEYNTIYRYPERSFALFYRLRDSSEIVINNLLRQMKDEIELEQFEFPEHGINPFEMLYAPDYFDMPGIKYYRYEHEPDF